MFLPPEQTARNTAVAGRRGFTLIELLVVLGIVVILAGILLPVFARVRARARLTKCINNHRQFSSAITIYTQEHDERYPGEKWPGELARYVTSEGMLCPDANGKTSYGVMRQFIGADLGLVRRPANTVLLVDSSELMPECECPLTYNHDGRTVWSYADGHTVSYATGALPDPHAGILTGGVGKLTGWNTATPGPNRWKNALNNPPTTDLCLLEPPDAPARPPTTRVVTVTQLSSAAPGDGALTELCDGNVEPSNEGPVWTGVKNSAPVVLQFDFRQTITLNAVLIGVRKNSSWGKWVLRARDEYGIYRLLLRCPGPPLSAKSSTAGQDYDLPLPTVSTDSFQLILYGPKTDSPYQAVGLRDLAVFYNPE